MARREWTYLRRSPESFRIAIEAFAAEGDFRSGEEAYQAIAKQAGVSAATVRRLADPNCATSPHLDNLESIDDVLTAFQGGASLTPAAHDARLVKIADVLVPIMLLQGGIDHPIPYKCIQYHHSNRRVPIHASLQGLARDIAHEIDATKSYGGISPVWDGDSIAFEAFRFARTETFSDQYDIEFEVGYGKYSDRLATQAAFRDPFKTQFRFSSQARAAGLPTHNWIQPPRGLCYGHPLNVAVVCEYDMKLMLTERSKDLAEAPGEIALPVNENFKTPGPEAHKKGEQLVDVLKRAFPEELGLGHVWSRVKIIGVLADVVNSTVSICGYLSLNMHSSTMSKHYAQNARDKEIGAFVPRNWTMKGIAETIAELLQPPPDGFFNYGVATFVYLCALHTMNNNDRQGFDRLIMRSLHEKYGQGIKWLTSGQKWWLVESER